MVDAATFIVLRLATLSLDHAIFEHHGRPAARRSILSWPRRSTHRAEMNDVQHDTSRSAGFVSPGKIRRNQSSNGIIQTTIGGRLPSTIGCLSLGNRPGTLRAHPGTVGLYRRNLRVRSIASCLALRMRLPPAAIVFRPDWGAIRRVVNCCYQALHSRTRSMSVMGMLQQRGLPFVLSN